MTRTLLVTGYLTWDAVERRSDRYGSVYLLAEPMSDDACNYVLLAEDLDRLEGRKGKLVAEVVEPVMSKHLGDWARKIYPSKPKEREFVLLGEGELFIEHRRPPSEPGGIDLDDKKMWAALRKDVEAAGMTFMDAAPIGPRVYDVIGLRPLDGRAKDWLNPRSLYRLHSSKVKLYFEEA